MKKVWLQQTEQETDQQLEPFLEEALEPRCKIIIHNDDVTPIGFVIAILQKIFQLDALIAERVTIIAHTTGLAYVTTLPCPEANRRVGRAHFAASLEGFPLTFTIEPEE